MTKMMTIVIERNSLRIINSLQQGTKLITDRYGANAVDTSTFNRHMMWLAYSTAVLGVVELGYKEVGIAPYKQTVPSVVTRCDHLSLYRWTSDNPCSKKLGRNVGTRLPISTYSVSYSYLGISGDKKRLDNVFWTLRSTAVETLIQAATHRPQRSLGDTVVLTSLKSDVSLVLAGNWSIYLSSYYMTKPANNIYDYQSVSVEYSARFSPKPTRYRPVPSL
ncbi:hypothetical protein J6590_073367 [Homalodisca vitripennis]|nr:hypothetical protein J6590_073367 [Homalodisca vitripennis]